MFFPYGFKSQLHKMVKHTQTICLSVLDHLVGLALKGLILGSANNTNY